MNIDVDFAHNLFETMILCTFLQIYHIMFIPIITFYDLLNGQYVLKV